MSLPVGILPTKMPAQTLPYTQDELDVINAQWEWLKESPNAMGGYYTSRYLLTAAEPDGDSGTQRKNCAGGRREGDQ